ncbi:MAG: alpha/beta hydrolase, partial [Pseudomonadales bacterium]|nr:alpha/beta hydrolase [Pseudomonadales bacterium]
VVLLSPFPESILSFTGCWEALTKKCRVIAIDLPGFGASEGDRKDMSPNAQGAHLAAIFDELDLQNIHLVAPDVGMGAALAYVLNHKHRAKSLAVGHGPGAPGPFKLAFMISMLARFGFMRFTTGLLGAGPLIAFSSNLGPSATGPMLGKSMIINGRTPGVPVRWFTGLRTFVPKPQRWLVG